MSSVAASFTPPTRILVVDDEVAQMRALCDTLSEHGYEARGFSAGEAALAGLRGEPFELLLVDLMMPGMDGIACLRAALTVQPDLVGIIMTGEGTIATAVESMKAGAFDYILKPFKLSVVLPVLARALAMRRLRLENTELTRQLSERAVELEAANRELETFAHSVSHDLRAPLRVISAYARIIVDEHGEEIPAEAKRLLDAVMAGTRRMQQLVDDLLRFSRLNRVPLSIRQVDVTALVREVLEELREQHMGPGTDIQVGDLPDTLADPALLRQVFINLISNALKFSRVRDPAKIEVGCRMQGNEAVYFVRDNGVGFDMKYAEKLFVAFQRFHSAPEFEGSGLGLSLVHRIVSRHGGRVWAEAAPERGAMFQFVLQ